MNRTHTSSHRSLAARAGRSLIALSLLGALHANAQLSTGEDLRLAIENSPGNVLVLNQPTKISSPSSPGTSHTVATGGTIILGPGVTFEIVEVAFTFNGPLVIQGDATQKATVGLSGSQIIAHSIAISLPGAGSSMTSKQTSLHSTLGNSSIAFGSESKLEFLERRGTLPGLSAAGTVSVSGGSKMSALFGDTAISGSGFSFAVSGDEGGFKADSVGITASAGSIAISALGAKGKVEMGETTLRFRDNATLSFTGADSLIAVKQTTFASTTALPAAGVLIEAGAGGSVQASEISVSGVVNVAIAASLAGEKGGVKLEKSRLSSSADLVIATGSQGNTTAVENFLTSGTRVRIATGVGGTCGSINNTVTAPIQQICP